MNTTTCVQQDHAYDTSLHAAINVADLLLVKLVSTLYRSFELGEIAISLLQQRHSQPPVICDTYLLPQRSSALTIGLHG